MQSTSCSAWNVVFTGTIVMRWERALDQEGRVGYSSVTLAVLTLGKFIPLSELVFLQTVK